MDPWREETLERQGSWRESGTRRIHGPHGYLAHKKTPTPLGLPSKPRHGPAAGSYEVPVSYMRGTTVALSDSIWLLVNGVQAGFPVKINLPFTSESI